MADLDPGSFSHAPNFNSGSNLSIYYLNEHSTRTAGYEMPISTASFKNLFIDNIENPDKGLILNNNYILTGNLHIGDASNSAGFLQINPGKFLTVNGTLYNYSGTSGLIIKSSGISSTGSLIHYTGSVPGTVERYYGGGSEWNMISAPISDATAALYAGRYLQSFDGCNWNDVTDAATPLIPEMGFALYNSIANTTSYIGTLDEGDYSLTLIDPSPTCDSSGTPCRWHMVGNPYTSSIDWNASSGWTKTNLSQTIYLENGSGWAYYNPTSGGINGGSRYIAVGQGFLVKALASSATLGMTNSIRVHNNTPFLKEQNVANNSVNLKVSGGTQNYSDEMIVCLLPDATPEYDADYDAVKIMAAANPIPQIYSLITGSSTCTNMMAINALPETQTDPVPIGFSTNVAGTYTITATEITGLNGVRLEDKTTGLFTDLMTNSYTFNFAGGENDTRFLLHFYPLGINNDTKNEPANIYSAGHTVYVNMKPEESGILYVYDITGQLVGTSNERPGPNNLTLTIPGGTYIAKLITNNQILVKKVILN